jgi:acetolactate synthase regulatory subunit
MKNTSTITTINLTAEDRRNIRTLKRQLEPEYGKLTLVAAIRILLRKAVKP